MKAQRKVCVLIDLHDGLVEALLEAVCIGDAQTALVGMGEVANRTGGEDPLWTPFACEDHATAVPLDSCELLRRGERRR